MDKKSSLIIIFLIFLGLYFYIYFHLTYFVFFNFDMPRQAIHVQEFITRGTFLTAQYFSEESVWGNISWGPSAVFFYALFLKISSSPLIVSYLLSFFNLLSIGAVVILVWKYFSKNAAIITGFLLATNPYWVTYVRIIWVPSPMTFFIPLSMYLFFEAFYGKKSWAQILLPVSWVALIQIYLSSYSFIATSFLASLFFYKSIKIKNLIIGSLLSLILLAPTINFYMNERVYIERIFEAPSLFTPAEKTFSERFTKVVTSFVLIPVGGVFEHQTGYGQKDFIKDYLPTYPYITPALSVLFICALVWSLYKVIFKKDYKRLIILLWAVTPIWSMIVLWVSDILPRYYLHAFPAIMIIIALFLTDLIKISKFFWIIPIGIIIYWAIFNISFNFFIKNYDYPNGRLVDVAETPYIYLKKAMDWVVNDSNKRKCNVVLSNNPEKPNFDVWLETKYVWEYVYHRSTSHLSTNLDPCYYVISYRNILSDLKIVDYKIFGQFIVFKN